MTVVTALPILLKLLPTAVMHRQVLGCTRHPFGHAVDPKLAKSTPMLDWSVCPLDLVAHPLIQSVFTLDRLAKIAPVSNWPTGLTAWAVEGLLLLRQPRSA